MEKSLIGYKEVELEVMVDCEKNGVIICSIENVDPCGIHTGDSITVAPAQTISDHCYQQLRTISLNIAKHMGVVAGGANVQFAINPKDENDIVVIEMNPRVSRSSALASKATGYPIAKISALLAVGYTLKDILNDITKASPVAFEPTLDYVAVKIPIFPFSKFPTSSKTLGPQMRSVGEVLALGGSFNEALLKALRSLEMGLEIPSLRRLKSTPFDIDKEYLCQRLQTREELSMLTVIEALRAGITPALINHYSAITPWFIDQAKDIVDHENTMKERSDDFKTNNDYSVELLRRSKELGFSDKFVAQLTNTTQEQIFKSRMDNNIKPVFKAVDTCSGEFAAQTPYFYSTYSVQNEAISMSETDRSIVIMGSGPNRIGQGIEFDYSCVKSCRHLKSKNIKAIMVNSNPETVSTDYDSSDRLYISALYSEDLFDIFLNEKPEGIIACFSGQTGINVRGHIEESFRKDFREFKFLGSSLETLDLTEDRKRFDDITKDTPLARTKSMEVQGIKKMTNAMIEIGLPVIIRPSYVIGGESMYIIHKHDEVHQLPETLKEQLNQPHMTFQVENYLEKALEYDVDLIRDEKGNCVFTVCEHIEHAGVHSGDSGMISPPVVLTSALYEKMKEISRQLAEKLNVTGPINFQYAVKDGDIYCIEANPRGSRTLPFLSKAYNLSLPQIATDAMLGETIESWDRETSGHFCVKQSTFPFDRFLQDNMVLGPKMRSTGETMGIDYDKDFAVLKSYLGNYPELDQKGKILISLSDPSKEIILPYLKTLHKIGFSFYATSGTFQYIKKQGIQCEEVAKINEEGTSILDVIQSKDVAMVFNTPTNTGNSRSDSESIRNTAIQYGLPCFTRNENITAVMNALIGTHGIDNTPLSLQKAHNLN
jgi:carbamoyl-phosphate synthase large subunit